MHSLYVCLLFVRLSLSLSLCLSACMPACHWSGTTKGDAFNFSVTELCLRNVNCVMAHYTGGMDAVTVMVSWEEGATVRMGLRRDYQYSIHANVSLPPLGISYYVVRRLNMLRWCVA